MGIIKKLQTGEVFAILLGAIIGWGAFMLPGTKFLHTSGVINTSIGIFLGTLCIVLIERSYRYMMHQDINEGGEFSYVVLFLGKKHGFIVGWFLFLAYLSLVPLNATAFPLVLNKWIPGLLDFGYLYAIAGDPVYLGEVLVSALIVLLFTYLNLKGTKQSGQVQFWIVVALVVCVILVTAGMLLTADLDVFYQNYIVENGLSLEQIVSVIAITPFLFIGFDAIPQLVKDMNMSRGRASLMAVTALLIGMFCYILLNFSTALAYSPQQAYGMEWALGQGVLEHLGHVGFSLLVIALASAVSGGINGFMICAVKLIGAMGRDDVLPNRLSKTNEAGINRNAIWFVSLVSIAACFFGREVVNWVVDMCSFGASVTYGYVCITTFCHAPERRVRIEAAAGALMSLGFTILLLVPSSPAALSTPALVFLGIWIFLGAVLFLRRFVLERQ
ncbi:APC family permease [Candidatus Agathobaculum pullicola]|uniref:APC family permease n=1 Tax=Candidatus Agathobaculum pullicola TaxID=2838426 RepID=UPI003F9030C3